MSQKQLPLLQLLKQSNLEKNDGLLRVFEDVHNHIYANDGLSAEQALEETVKILFLKIFDEKNDKYEFKISPEEFAKVVNGGVSKEFSERFDRLQRETFLYYKDLFEDAEKIKLKTSSLGYVVNKLQSIDLLKSSSDAKGLAFQKFIHSSQRAGRGQFFTPEQVVRLCLGIIQPNSNETILDPTCGSGGFLSAAVQYVGINEPRKVDSFAKGNVYGIEISSTAAKIAKMRMILDGDGYASIARHNSLADWSEIDEELRKVRTGSKQETYKETFDVVLTNPPFGTQGKIVDKEALGRFDLGYKWTEDDGKFSQTRELLNGQVPEILFIERCLQFLKPGGRMAIVLPNGDFENSSLGYLRNYIQSIADVFAVVKLPQETFVPSGTGVKTSILFLRKKGGTTKAKGIFFSEVTKLGYAGNKSGALIYKKDSHGKILRDDQGEPLIDEDVSDVIADFLSFTNNGDLADSKNSYVVNEENFGPSRLDFEFYKPLHRQAEKILLENGAKRLGELVEIQKTKSMKLRQKDLAVRYVELSDVGVQYSEIINSTELLVHELPSRATYELHKGDVLVAVAGNSIGTANHASAYVTAEYDGCICTNGFRVLSVNTELINPYYLLYYFKSQYFLDQVFRFRTGAAIPSLQDVDLMNILVPVPGMAQQNKIGSVIEEGFKQRQSYKELLGNVEISL